MQLAENGDPELTQMGVPTVFERPKQKTSVRCSASSSAAPRCRDPSLLLPVCRQNALQCCERGSKRPSRTPALIAEAEKMCSTVSSYRLPRSKTFIKTTFATDPVLIEKVRNAYSGKREERRSVS